VQVDKGLARRRGLLQEIMIFAYRLAKAVQNIPDIFVKRITTIILSRLDLISSLNAATTP
jgi:hypothetical protein